MSKSIRLERERGQWRTHTQHGEIRGSTPEEIDLWQRLCAAQRAHRRLVDHAVYCGAFMHPQIRETEQHRAVRCVYRWYHKLPAAVRVILRLVDPPRFDVWTDDRLWPKEPD